MSTRKHIFRAKAVSDGEWVYGYLNEAISPMKSEDGIVSKLRIGRTFIIEDTIGEFTGIRDRNGVDVYEDDIILCHGHRYIVKWSQEYSAFIYQQINSRQWYNLTIRDLLGVVGNIHDNKDLVKQGE